MELNSINLLPGCPARPWLTELGGSRFGTETSDDRGRVRVYLGVGHRFANSGGWQWRNRLLVMYTLGERLRADEHVHHKDFIVYHDVIWNLEVSLAEYHGRYHATLFTLAECRGKDGRFKSIEETAYRPFSASRVGAIISDRRIDTLQGPERRTCEAGCEICTERG